LIRPNPWYHLLPLCLGLTACTENQTPAAASAAPAKSAALTLAAEPTFESIPTSSELMTQLRASLRDPVDTPEEQQAIQEVEAELGTFTYVRPSTLAEVDPSAGAPMGRSFIEDGEWAAARVKALYGADVEVSCLTRPCIQYGDFDADGRRDLVVQVAEDVNDKTGIAFLMADQTHALIGAGRSSALGDDLLWMDKWQVVPRTSGSGSAVVLGTASQTARAELSLTPGPGGARAVTTAWTCSASSQVPAMTGPNTPRGIVTRSGVLTASDEAWQAFDANPTGTQWVSEVWPSSPVWIGYEWSDGPRQITRYSLRFINAGIMTRAPRDFQLQGWNGTAWVTVDSRTQETGWSTEERHYTVASPGSYNKYRLYVTEDNDDRATIVAVSLGNITLSGANCNGSGGLLP
jgi:hypothetical protein